jgi:hypothetical protein
MGAGETAMIEDQLAAAFRERLDALTFGHLRRSVRPGQASTRLTLDELYRAQDRVLYPPEPYWYLCHPDDLTRMREVLGQDRPDKHTCPIVRPRRECPPGKLIRIRIDYDLLWPWPWQRQ